MDTSGFGQWSTSLLSTPTRMSSVKPTAFATLTSLAASITSEAAHETNSISLWNLSKSMRGVLASLTILQQQEAIATATDAQVLAHATQAVIDASLNLQNLYDEANLYQENLAFAGNLVFAIAFGLLFVVHTGLLVISQEWYFGICFFFGAGAEFGGYVGRTVAVIDETQVDPFLCQIICLTIAPAFIMAGVYFLLAQLVVVHHKSKSSLLPPLMYSYIFITCDVISLVLQAVGGGMAAVAVERYEDTDLGTHVMLAGICFQVLSMTLFLYFLGDFLVRSFFIDPKIDRTLGNFLAILFATKKGRRLRREGCEMYYSPAYSHMRQTSSLFDYFPLVILCASLLVYVRCIYRVVELSQGWSGHLITHEIYLFILDGVMLFFAILLFVLFHPFFVFGKNHGLDGSVIKNHQEQTDEEILEENAERMKKVDSEFPDSSDEKSTKV